MRIFAVLVLFSVSLTVSSQAIYRNVKSKVLNGERKIKILPPRNYGENPEKTYPLIIVLDGDYLFEPVAGNVDYLSYWDQMPESIVLGVNMLQSRYTETDIDPNNGLPRENGQKLMDFLMELKDMMEKDYRVAPFTVMVGQDITANFSSFYLMRDKIPIEAFIHIRPEYTDLIKANLDVQLQKRQKINFFYAGTTAKDTSIDGLLVNQIDTTGTGGLKTNIKIEKFEGTNQYSVATNAIASGLQFIFKSYSIIDEDTIKELTAQGDTDMAAPAVEKFEPVESDKGDTSEPQATSEEAVENENTTDGGEEISSKPKKRSEQLNAVNKLIAKQRLIYKTYGFIEPHKLVDVVKLADVLIEREDWDQLIKLGDFAHREFETLLYGEFIQGFGYERIGRVSRAIKSYEKAYILEPTAGISADDVLDRIEALKARD
ncbi:MAG: esterase [Nonlabens sp.]